MSSPFLGQLMLVPYNFSPRGWAFCQGQILSIAQNTALFALVGTTYGGNGQTTFALPDLRGRVPISSGQGPGLSNYSLGQLSGTENTTLLSTNMPAHTHTATAALNANSGPANDSIPNGNFLAEGSIYRSTANATMNSGAVAVTVNPTGGSQPFSIVQPYLTLNWVIALQGIFPSRN